MKLVSFSSWENRPTALYRTPAGDVFALSILRPGEDWTEVDAPDVWRYATGSFSIETLNERFGKKFGSIVEPSAEKLIPSSPAAAS